MAHMDWKGAGTKMSGKEKAPKKEVREIRIRKNHQGTGHIIEHHHTHPDHHPMEEHTTMGDNAMMQAAQGAVGGASEPQMSAAPEEGAAPGATAPVPGV